MNYMETLTPRRIEEATGFSMAIRFADGPNDGAVLASYHDEHERLVKELGWENVIGSLCIDDDQLVLGIFVRRNNIIEGRLVTKEITGALQEIEPSLPEQFQLPLP